MSDAPDILSIIRRVGGDPADLPFWEACRDGRFLLHRCGVCGRHYWPASRCFVHGNQDMQWVKGAGVGTLYTYTVMHHAYTPAMKSALPYVVGVIQLDEGPFFHSNVVDCPVDAVAIGMRVRAVMREQENGLVLPMFEPFDG